MARKIKIDNSILKNNNRNKKEIIREPRCTILIVCEGKKTEPNYFRAFDKNKFGNFVFDLQIEGIGQNTLNVVNKAIELRKGSPNNFDAVWAVFDRDSFSENQFNSAIEKAIANEINVAWSNEAFELWYLFHFHNRITAMKRDEYKKAISDAVNKKRNVSKTYKYAKNDECNYTIMTQDGDQSQAILWAEEQHKHFIDDDKFAKHNPCTTVYKLVRQLIGEDKEFINKVMRSINQK